MLGGIEPRLHGGCRGGNAGRSAKARRSASGGDIWQRRNRYQGTGLPAQSKKPPV